MIETAVIWSIQWWESGNVGESWADSGDHGWNDAWCSVGFLETPLGRSQSYASISSVSWKDPH